MKKLFLFAMTAMFAVSTWAAPTQVELKLRNGQKMQIDFCTDSIFRVRVSEVDTFATSWLERYGLIKNDWAPVKVAQRNVGESTIYTTSAYKVWVSRKDGSIRVTDLKDKPIVQEAAYLGTGTPVIEEMSATINEKFQKPRREEAIIGDTTNAAAAQQQTELGDISNNTILSFILADDERFYGGGSTSRDHIQHRGELLRMWATYQIAEAPIPFMMSSAGWGVFNTTTVRNYFDVARFDKERMLIYNTTSGADFYLIMGGSLQKTLNLYTLITGRAYVLPRWMYGLSFGGHMQ